MFINYKILMSSIDRIFSQLQHIDEIAEFSQKFQIMLRKELSKIPVYKISLDQAKEIIDNIEYKEELGLDFSTVINDLDKKIHMDMLDNIIRRKDHTWKIEAIKYYRNYINPCGLQESKEYVEKRYKIINK